MADRTDLDIIKRDRGRLEAELKSAGAEVKGDAFRCPFHDDKTASGSIYGANGRGYRAKCHACDFSGSVVDVLMKAEGIDFDTACARLGVKVHDKSPRNATKPRTEMKPARTIQEVEQEAHACHERLMGDPAVLQHLWRSRGIDAATARRFEIGITDGKPGARYWTFPIVEGLAVIGIKAHRADGQKSKSWWWPEGIGRDHLFPLHVVAGGPVWLCPGELKALAVVGLGAPALGITSGEVSGGKPNDLPLAALQVLQGRPVAIPQDDDDAGRAWGSHVQEQLSGAGIDAWIVDLGLSKSDGLKDIGDWLRLRLVDHQRDAESVAAELAEAYRRSDPWYGVHLSQIWQNPQSWKSVTTITTGLGDLDRLLGGGLRTRGVHLIAGKSGQCKTQVGVTLAVNAARDGKPTGYISLELGADDISKLIAAQITGVPRQTLDAGEVTGEYRDRLILAIEKWKDCPLDILDDERWPAGLTRNRLARLIAEGAKRFGWRLVLVDYLGLLAAPESDRSDYQTDLLNSSVLRRVAHKHDIALVVVAALRKSANHKRGGASEEKGITLDDVAGAGRLVYDAQSVLLIANEQGDGGSGLVRVRPLKLRFAPLVEGAEICLRWWSATGQITDLEK